MSTLQHQRESLIALYHATGGEEVLGHWSRTDNWNQNLVEGTELQPMSSFYGVTTDESGAVVRLDLAKNGLSGSRNLPP